MKHICYVSPYIDFEMSENLLNRINLLDQNETNISLVCYDGSYVNYIEDYCQERKITVHKINKESLDMSLTIQNLPFLISWDIYKMLKDIRINEIHFVDYVGSGYHCIQAKKTSMSFSDTKIIIEMFGASQFKNEANEEWGYGGFEQLMVQYMERYCCQFCDEIISPTNYLITWALNRRWKLCENIHVIPFAIINDVNIEYCYSEDKKLCLVYCGGNIGKDGGIHLFINALKRLNIIGHNELIRKIIFVGEYKKVESQLSHEYIEANLRECDYEWEIAGANDTKRILDIVCDNEGVLIFPSHMGINGTNILTAAKYGIKMIVSNNGSHKEIFEEDSLFVTSPTALVDFIINRKFAVYKNVDQLVTKRERIEHRPIKHNDELPLVTICTAYYNHGKFIDETRKSIESQDYPNIEWIVIDDGSTDKYSIEILDKYRKIYKDKPYKFLTKKNEGPSIARNFGASHANGEMLIFMDSDNVAKPSMVRKFVSAMHNSNSDCLTCYFDQFLGEEGVNRHSLNGITYALLGPSLETGVFSNCFGDTNFIIKKSVFEEVEGFLPQRVVTEDWQILSKIAIKGYEIDVIPEALFWYRVLPESNVSYGSEYYKQQIILRTYCDELPPYVYHIFNSLCRPSLSLKDNLKATKMGALYIKLMDIANKRFPVGSKRRYFLRKIIDLFIQEL